MRVLITGGAGFIGGHIAADYSNSGHEVIVFDDLSTGDVRNIPEGAEFIRGDVRDLDSIRGALRDIELVFHEAAARAVLRSVEDPIDTDRVNTLGTLNVLVAARDNQCRRVVLASSSSIYGGGETLPTPESAPLRPRSPYAVSKLAGESYARVFTELYGLETVALRYFNVYGPRQRPESPYAAVIPLFIEALAAGRSPIVHGDGRQSRDFTYVEDVVRANILAAATGGISGNAYNIGRGEHHSLLELLDLLQRHMGTSVVAMHDEPRSGDVWQSCADIGLARRDLGFVPSVSFERGLEMTLDWYRDS